MATPDVTHQVNLPTGARRPKITAELQLMVSDDEVAGHGITRGGETIAGRVTVTANSSGFITFPDVAPNTGPSADVVLTPAGSRWRMIVTNGDQRQAPLYARIEDLAGPLKFVDHLTSPPAGLTAAVAAASTTFDDDDVPFSADTVQDALDELAATMYGTASDATHLGQAIMAPLYAQLATGNARIAIVADSRTVLSRAPDDVDRWFADNWKNDARSPGSSRPITAAEGWTGTGTETDASVALTATGSSGYYTTLAVGQSRTWTPDEPCTALSVTHRKGAAGTFTVAQGATVRGTVVCDAGAATWSNIATTTPAALSLDAWTITCTSGSVDVEDATPHARTTPATGIKVLTFAHSGYSLTNWLSVSSVRTALTNWNPDAIVIASGVNEGTDPAVTVAAHETFVSAMRTDHGADIPILIVSPEPVRGTSGTLDVSQAVLDVADSLGCAKLNLTRILGGSNAWNDVRRLSGDTVHGGASWSRAYALALTAILSGDPLAVILGAWAENVALFRAQNIQITDMQVDNGLLLIGDWLGFGHRVAAAHDTGDEDGALAGHYPQIIDLITAAAAAEYTSLGLPMPGPGTLYGAGGAAPPDSYIARTGTTQLSTNADWRARSMRVSGVTGAASSAMLAGRTASGAPSTGTHEVGEIAITDAGDLWICTVAGTPGTWVQVGAAAAAAAQAASQPLDSDLTAIAALSTTSYGRALLALADAAAGRTALGLGTLSTLSTVASANITDGTIVNGDVSASAALALSKLATQATMTVVGNVTGSTAVPTALTATQLRTILGSGVIDTDTGVTVASTTAWTSLLTTPLLIPSGSTLAGDAYRIVATGVTSNSSGGAATMDYRFTVGGVGTGVDTSVAGPAHALANGTFVAVWDLDLTVMVDALSASPVASIAGRLLLGKPNTYEQQVAHISAAGDTTAFVTSSVISLDIQARPSASSALLNATCNSARLIRVR